MKKILWILPITILIWTIHFPSLSHSIEMDPEIKKSYTASDYVTAAKLLEQLILRQKEKALKGEKIDSPALHRQYLFLARIYAWRLNNPEMALSKYQDAYQLRKSSNELNKYPPFEFLFMGEIFEKKNDLPKAKEFYQNLLKELMTQKETDDVLIIAIEDLIRLIQYQIDGLYVKTPTTKKNKPLLRRLKLSSQFTPHVISLLAMLLVPTVEYDFALAEKSDFSNLIKLSSIDIGSMIQNYVLVLSISAGSVTESSERAMEAYLSKYPESYYSLSLRYLFYKFYKENEQIRKAGRMARELESIADKRGMEIIIGPDKRFSSPEKTWETYRNAMKAGDIDTVMDCYVQGTWKEREIFTLLGKEKMKEIGKDLRDIEKISAGDKEAEYHILRKRQGREYSYGIHFHNIDGEWKMREF